MNRIGEILLGIERRAPGVTAGGDSRLEFAALPRGTGALSLVLAALALALLFWRLYRWERRELSPVKRCFWSACAC